MTETPIKRFQSKKDFWLMFVLIFTFIFGIIVIVKAISDNSVHIVFKFLLFILLGTTNFFILWFVSKTYYEVFNDRIEIYCGPMKYTVKIKEIRDIFPKKTLLSSPGLSFDRIVIKYKKFSEIYISPENKEEFILLVNKLRTDKI